VSLAAFMATMSRRNFSAILGITLPPVYPPMVAAIAEPAETFRKNMLRAIYSVQMLPELIELASARKQFEMECLEGTGTDHYGHERTEKVHPNDVEYKVWEKLTSVSIYDLRPHGVAPVYYRYPAQILDLLSEKLGETRKGFEAILSSVIVQTWTAFETLAGDLWEAAINGHPSGLAELRGSAGRIWNAISARMKTQDMPIVAASRPKPSQGGAKAEAESKQLPLDRAAELSEGTFNLSDKMGSLLRPIAVSSDLL
jgi:hypothetical protein